MIQDIYPHKLYNQFIANVELDNEDIVLNIVNGKVLIDKKKYEDNILIFPKVKDFSVTLKSQSKDDFEIDCHKEMIFLFKVDNQKYFLYLNEVDIEKFDYVEEKLLRKVGLGPAENLFAAITGKHLADWYRDTCFCGRCGNKMNHSKKERAMVCEACKYTAYPRIMPAVIVGVKNGDKLLITRYKTGYAHNALIAGFTEIGETVEETVAREVMEEAGIKVKNIMYYKSQPWGSANDILLGFFCDVDGDDKIKMDDEELKYAEWVKREEIVLQPGHFSLTNEMMERFKMGLE